MKRIILASSVLLASIASPAMAADMDYPIRGTANHRTNVEYGSGWYLRGDVGMTFGTSSTLSYFSDARYDYDNQSLGETAAWTLGMGYTFNEFLRGDLTVEGSGSHQWSGTSVGTICGGGTPGDCYSEDSADFDRTSLMANAYVSLGNYSGFTPYVGGGVGLSHIQWNNYSSDAYCTVDVGETCDYGTHTGVGTDPETYYGGNTTYPTESLTALTYSLAAGVDYRINNNWLVDLGYKWTHVHGGVVINENANGVGSPQGDSKFDGINMHEVKIGLRYEIW